MFFLVHFILFFVLSVLVSAMGELSTDLGGFSFFIREISILILRFYTF